MPRRPDVDVGQTSNETGSIRQARRMTMRCMYKSAGFGRLAASRQRDGAPAAVSKGIQTFPKCPPLASNARVNESEFAPSRSCRRGHGTPKKSKASGFIGAFNWLVSKRRHGQLTPSRALCAASSHSEIIVSAFDP